MLGARTVDTALCLTNYGTSAKERDICPNSCQQENNAELVEAILAASQNQEKLMQEQMTQFAQALGQQQQMSQQKMAQMMMQMNQNTNQALMRIVQQRQQQGYDFDL